MTSRSGCQPSPVPNPWCGLGRSVLSVGSGFPSARSAGLDWVRDGRWRPSLSSPPPCLGQTSPSHPHAFGLSGHGRVGLTAPLGCAFLCRPLREDPPDAERQEAQEEEDDGEEEDAEPLLQRVLQLRDPLRADSGAGRGWRANTWGQNRFAHWGAQALTMLPGGLRRRQVVAIGPLGWGGGMGFGAAKEVGWLPPWSRLGDIRPIPLPRSVPSSSDPLLSPPSLLPSFPPSLPPTSQSSTYSGMSGSDPGRTGDPQHLGWSRGLGVLVSPL